MAIPIIKSSGQKDDFSKEKLTRSLIRSGASAETAFDIAEKVEKQLPPFIHTRNIYRLARKYLRKHNHASGMRYALKRALFSLGPSGYPFEKYIARILRTYGYKVEVGRILDGHCVRHEVDVFAVKGKEQCIIECKYHSRAGSATDVKVALYVRSRFLDIKKALKKASGKPDAKYYGWLVTNTRCTSDAIRYAECAGLKIVSWKYPPGKSLENLIEEERLYPVTILPSAGKKQTDVLFKNDIILAQDIANMGENAFIAESGLDVRAARLLKGQADEICSRTG